MESSCDSKCRKKSRLRKLIKIRAIRLINQDMKIKTTKGSNSKSMLIFLENKCRKNINHLEHNLTTNLLLRYLTKRNNYKCRWSSNAQGLLLVKIGDKVGNLFNKSKIHTKPLLKITIINLRIIILHKYLNIKNHTVNHNNKKSR